MENKLFFIKTLSFLLFFSCNVMAENCLEILKLSRLQTSTVMNKTDATEQVESFCEDYSKYVSRGKTGGFGVSYAGFGVNANSGSASVDSIAKKLCRHDNISKASSSAYSHYADLIAPGGYNAYEACLSSNSPINFTITESSPLSSLIILGFLPDGANDTADFGIESTEGVNCVYKSGFQPTKVDPDKMIFSVEGDTITSIRCTRKKSDRSDSINIVRYDTGDSTSAISIPWAPYKDGVPFSTLKKYEDATLEHDKLKADLDKTAALANSNAKRISGLNTRLSKAENFLKNPTFEQCEELDKPTSCSNSWVSTCPTGKVLVGLSNKKGSNSCSTAYCCSIKY